MEILSPTEAHIRRAAEALDAGLLVAFPTETVYGLGAEGFTIPALVRVFEAKGRPRFDPLIIHIADMAGLDRLADLSSLAGTARARVELLCGRLWPGPLTLILPKRPGVPDIATSGLPTVAVRFPDHPVAQKLIRLSSGTIAAPSANPFGYLSPTRAEHVRDQLGERVDFILDGGRSPVGVESTVLDLSGERPRILRPGGLPRETIEALIGPVDLPGRDSGAPTAPGQLKSHYAPRTVLSLHSPEEMIALDYDPSGVYLFFAPGSRKAWIAARREQGIPVPPAQVWTLSETGDLRTAAANLFDLLHELDRLGASRIRAERAPPQGLGLAINDRLSRAAAGKITDHL
ncbi:MAG: threonylcarbamoyl-AMP synthase [Treponema sp.]|jgi:L-threonylcarbamoyladenylate synthase|nr:threonylcarbamoyl-AMP synthase [Treponema sp.]